MVFGFVCFIPIFQHVVILKSSQQYTLNEQFPKNNQMKNFMSYDVDGNSVTTIGNSIRNVARSGNATQSSTYRTYAIHNSPATPASNAIDGNTDGNFFESESHSSTEWQENPWVRNNQFVVHIY